MRNTDEIHGQKELFCAFCEQRGRALSFEEFKGYITSDFSLCDLESLNSFYCEDLEKAYFFFKIRKEALVLIIGDEELKLDLQKSLYQKREMIKREGRETQLLYKALGLGKLKKYENLWIYDSTAGLGEDLCWFLAFGLNIMAKERSPVLYCLLANSLKRLAPRLNEVKLLWGEGEELPVDRVFHALYYDPFFEKKKKRKTKKSMEFISSHFKNGGKDDLQVAKNLFDHCKSRLIIKRSDKAPQLIKKPTYEIKGKTVRFDIYYRGSKL